MCQHRKHVGKLAAYSLAFLRDIGMHFRDKAGMIADILMHVPVIYSNDRSAVGMTMN